MNQRSMMRSSLRASVLVLCALAIAHGPAAAAPKTAPAVVLQTFRSELATIEATEHLQWMIPLRIENRSQFGMYLDSLTCEVDDLDPGETRTERHRVNDVTMVVAREAVSAGDTFTVTHAAPAAAERARLTFHLQFHRGDKSRTTLTTVVEAMPGPVSRGHPSEFLTVSGRRVEYVVFPADRDSAPGLLLVHGFGGNARKLMNVAQRLAPRGFTVMLVSMPGYGLSEGPPDYDGPATLQALGAALDQLKATPGVDPKRVAAWGISRGAAAVALLAQHRPDLRAAVAESGSYDLWSVYRAATDPDRRKAIVSEAGSDSSGWRARSPACDPGKPNAILILHGEQDVLAPVLQARGFAALLEARGAGVETKFFPNSGHEMPPGQVTRAAVEFLDHRLEK